MINSDDELIKSSFSVFTPCVELLLSRRCLYVHMRDRGHEQTPYFSLSHFKLHTVTFSLSFDKNAPLGNQYEKPF